MKNLIIGAFTGYNYNQLKPWAESIETVGIDCDKVVIVFDTDIYTLEELNRHGWQVVKAQANPKVPIHVERFIYIYNWLMEDKKWEEYNYIITTDVKDVYFQRDPFKFMEHILDLEPSQDWPYTPRQLISSGESLIYNDEPWGKDNFTQAFGPYFFDQFKNSEIQNVGVLAGTTEYIKDLCLQIFLMSLNRPIPIVDQASYNALIHTQPYFDATYFASDLYAWACQAGTVADPSKIDYFRPFLLTKEPKFINGEVCNSIGEPYHIVHQYDRVPEWKAFVKEKFNQTDDVQLASDVFVYKT